MRFILCLAILLIPSLCRGAEQGADSAPILRSIDPKADAILHKLADFFALLKTVSVEMKMTMHVQMQGIKQDMPAEYTFAVQRPNKFALILRSGIMGATIVSDGQKAYTYVPLRQEYTVTDAPADFSGLNMAGEAGALSGGMGNVGFVGALFQEKPYEAMTKGITREEYAGLETLNNVSVHHLRIVQSDGDWEMWIDAGAKPFVRKVEVDMSKMVGKTAGLTGAPPGLEGLFKEMKMQLTMVFDNWAPNPALDKGRFQFDPPANAKKVDSFFEAAPEETELVGKPAPEARLDLLDGGKLDLASHKGKNVVILDFWATWCGPCIKALPVISGIAEKYKAKGVVLYAVNEREQPDEIKSFLKKKGLNLNVALDASSDIGEAFGVDGIPQTVLIDKAGVVQAIHVGFSPDTEAELARELDTILEGKNLFFPAAKKEKISKP